MIACSSLQSFQDAWRLYLRLDSTMAAVPVTTTFACRLSALKFCLFGALKYPRLCKTYQMNSAHS